MLLLLLLRRPKWEEGTAKTPVVPEQLLQVKLLLPAYAGGVREVHFDDLGFAAPRFLPGRRVNYGVMSFRFPPSIYHLVYATFDLLDYLRTAT